MFVCLFVCIAKLNIYLITTNKTVINLQNILVCLKQTNVYFTTMKGSDLKEFLRKEGVVFSQLAEDLGMSQQNLSAVFTRDDVKSGLLERLSGILNKPIGYFYGEVSGSAQVISGNINTQVAGEGATVSGADSRLLGLLETKDEQLTLAMNQVSKAQEQMDRLLGLISR